MVWFGVVDDDSAAILCNEMIVLTFGPNLVADAKGTLLPEPGKAKRWSRAGEATVVATVVLHVF